MKPITASLTVAVALTAWAPAGFAQRQSAVGPGNIPLSASGTTYGVDMTGSATTGTLVVGTVGGPETDIFTNNTALAITPLAVSTDASNQSSILFNSSSTVYGGIGTILPGGPVFLNISGATANSTVNFLGGVYATTIDVTGTGTMNFNNGGFNDGATNFGADGTVSLAPNTTLIGALTTTAGADTGTLNLGNASELNGAAGGAIGLKAINVLGGSNLAGGSATISGAVDAYAINLDTNTLNIGGALTLANMTPSGVINTTIASQSVYGNIRVSGSTSLGPTLSVLVAVPAGALINVGSQFNIVASNSAQSGTSGSVVTVQDPTNPLYKFAPFPLAGTALGLVEIIAVSTPLQAPLTPTPGNPIPPTQPIAAPLVPILVNLPPTPGVTSVITAINSLTTAPAVDNAIAQLAPSTAAMAAPLVAFQGSREFQNLIAARLQNTVCSDINNRQATLDAAAACQGVEPKAGWWLKGFGYEGDQSAQHGYSAYQSTIVGTMVGFDTPIDANTRVGIGLGYAHTGISQKSGIASSTDSSTYQATAYVGHDIGPWFMDADLAFGWNDYTGRRQISLPGVSLSPHANYDGQQYSAFAITGYNFYAGTVTFTPLASLQYTKVNLASYHETGAGDVGLNVKSQSYNFLESGLGARISDNLHYGALTYVPDLHAKWLHELNNPSISQSAAFAAASSSYFSTPGMKPPADTFDIGAGLTLLSCACTARTWSIEAVYDHYFSAGGASADQGMLRYTHTF